MKFMVKMVLNIVIYFLSGFSIRNSRRVVFGAWEGKLYGDNSKYLFEYLLMEKDLELIWVGSNDIKDKLPIRKNVKFARINSLKAYYYAINAKFVFFTNGYTDITKLNVLRKAIITQLWHGGGIKRILADSAEAKKAKGVFPISSWYNYRIGKHTFNKCQFFITSSEERERNIYSAFRYFGITENSVIKHGQPRNDVLIHSGEKDILNLRNKFKEEFNIPKDKKIILYLPTFRDKKQEINFSFYDLIESNRSFTNVLLENDAVIIEKKHLKVANSSGNIEENGFLYDLTSHAKDIDTQELMLISDILITDYSGAYLDFLLLDKPIIHFAYDYEYYKKEDRGFKYDIKDVAGGVFVEKTEDLINEVRLHLNDRKRSKDIRDSMNLLMNSYENGESCTRIVEAVLGRK